MAEVQITDNTDEFKKALEDVTPRILEAIGIHIEGEAKDELENDPRRIDTGLLRNSITHALSGEPAAIKSYHASFGENRNKKTGKRIRATAKSAGDVKVGFYSGTAPNDPPNEQAIYIGTNVEYAPYVHDGTQKMTANRFLKKAVERNENKIKKYVENNLKNA